MGVLRGVGRMRFVGCGYTFVVWVVFVVDDCDFGLV